MKKIIAVLLMTLTVLTLMVGCNKTDSDPGTSWDYIEKNGKLIVGLDDTFAPMGFRENGELVGFDIDLAKKVGEKLNIKIEFKPISWDAKDLELKSKRIDCIWNGMSKTPEREKSMCLSPEYLNNKIVIMGKNADEIKTLNDLKGKKIAIQAKSAALEALKSNTEIYEAVKGNVSELPDYDNAILTLKNGRNDVMIVDEVLGQFKNSKLSDADKLKVATANFGDDLYVIGFRKGADEIQEKVALAMKEVIDSGEAKSISEKWFGENLVLPIK